MQKINNQVVLNTLIRHETLTVNDLSKEENLGIAATPQEVQPLLDELREKGFVIGLDNVTPATYTITEKGISEGKKMIEEVEV